MQLDVLAGRLARELEAAVDRGEVVLDRATPLAACLRRWRWAVTLDYVQVELPEPADRWTINADTGLVEAWDHTLNPHRADDYHALDLCEAALDRDEWSHPYHSRREAEVAVAATQIIF